MMRQKKCGCGRSPTGSCVGWHSLTDEVSSRENGLREKNELPESKT